MAKVSFQLDPNAVTEVTFNAHTHNYRKMTQLLVDASDPWNSPKSVDVIDDSTVHQIDLGQDLEAVGVTVATLPTSTPT